MSNDIFYALQYNVFINIVNSRTLNIGQVTKNTNIPKNLNIQK